MQELRKNESPRKRRRLDGSAEEEDAISFVEHKLEDNGTVLYYERFLDSIKVKSLFEALLKLKYERGEFQMFGKTVKTPRLQCVMSTESMTDKFGSLYQSQPRHDWTDYMLDIKHSIEKLLECEFDLLLVNYYRNGRDYIGWHSDREARPKCCNVVASVSLGGPRRFVLRHNEWRKRNIPKREMLLASGSLVVMLDDTQKKWKHSIPKSARKQRPRINLTFRRCCPHSVRCEE